jgi:hypothetical protein
LGIFYLEFRVDNKVNLPFKHFGVRVSSVVGKVDFANVNGVIGQIEMYYIGVVTLNVEFQDLPVILEELFLRLHSAAP